MTRTRQPADPAPAVVELAGGIADDLVAYARRKIATVLARTGRPVPYSRLRVERHADPARQRPVTAHASVDLDGRPVHVEVAATKPREAVDLLLDRLAHRLEREARGWSAHRAGREHARPPARRPDPRPLDEQEIVRHLTVRPSRCTIDEAVAEMADLGHDFHLFVEAGRGVDSVVYRAGPTGIRLAQVDGRTDLVAPGEAPVSRSGRAAPLLSVPEAAERLALAGLPFVFFLDGERCRGGVLYRRHDGDYGLIDPRPEADPG